MILAAGAPLSLSGPEDHHESQAARSRTRTDAGIHLTQPTRPHQSAWVTGSGIARAQTQGRWDNRSGIGRIAERVLAHLLIRSVGPRRPCEARAGGPPAEGATSAGPPFWDCGRSSPSIFGSPPGVALASRLEREATVQNCRRR